MTIQAIHPILEALGWALLHFIWQGALLALLLLVFQTLARRSSAELRYAAGCIAMSLMVAVFAATVFQHFPTAPTPVIRNPLTARLPMNPAPAGRPALASPPPIGPLTTGPPDWIACLWLLGVATLSAYTAMGLARVQRLKHQAVEPLCVQSFASLQRRLGVSRVVRLYTSALAEAPAVIGWLRPYILLPVTALTGLSESQLRAILAHELAHIRRRDYLVNLLQTAVETLLFYHPAVWWVGRQIRQEREHCCDDIAVSVCGDPVEYASALAQMEEIRTRIPESTLPEPALAATGGDLLSRIRRLLGEQDHASRSLGTIAATALALLIAAAPALVSQQPPAFEVASIKPNHSGDPNRLIRPSAGGVSVSNMYLQDLMVFAYQVRDFQISGGPGWLTVDQFDIEAKAQGNASLDQTRLMMQSLLADRFKLAVHREIKELPIFELTLAKGGFKVQPMKDGSCIPRDPKNPTRGVAPGKTRMDYCGYGGLGQGTLELASATMSELATFLSAATRRTVVDKTGIAGQYRLRLTFVPDETAPAATDGPSIFTALPEQLGLKLDSAKGPVEVLVIDHAEKPSEN
jgi:uncharacterized protein (TIGR03435 family)